MSPLPPLTSTIARTISLVCQRNDPVSIVRQGYSLNIAHVCSLRQDRTTAEPPATSVAGPAPAVTIQQSTRSSMFDSSDEESDSDDVQVLFLTLTTKCGCVFETFHL